jgi:hypothetical protein
VQLLATGVGVNSLRVPEAKVAPHRNYEVNVRGVSNPTRVTGQSQTQVRQT